MSQERYNLELAGRQLGDWMFAPYQAATAYQDGLSLRRCVRHRSAQFDFALDENLAVYVYDEAWVRLYSSVFDLAQLEMEMAAKLPAEGEVSVEALGEYASVDDFEVANVDMLSSFAASRTPGDEFNAVYQRPGEVIRLGRTFDSEMATVHALRYRAAGSGSRTVLPTPPRIR